jgi:hypothetical protein
VVQLTNVIIELFVGLSDGQTGRLDHSGWLNGAIFGRMAMLGKR